VAFGEFVVAAAQILHEAVHGDDHLRGPIRSEAAHRPEPVLELTVICLDRIVRVAFDVVSRRRDQLLDDSWVNRGGVGDADERVVSGRHNGCLSYVLSGPPGSTGNGRRYS
jgi:hypothetical protein